MNNLHKKAIKTVIFSLSIVAGLLLLLVAGFLLFLVITEYKPPITESIKMEKMPIPDTIPCGKIELYTWNIGHCGMGKHTEWPEGKSYPVLPEISNYERNRDGILYQLTTLNKLDFVLLQEVDQESKRSHHDNQVERFKASFSDYSAAFAVIQKTKAIPIIAPQGGILSGLLTLSRYQPLEATRMSFPSAYGWLQKKIKPDYGLLLTRYLVNNGKHLVILNIQNPEFTASTNLNEKVLTQLKNIAESEYAKGNYVIVGGQWNMNPAGFAPEVIKDGNKAYKMQTAISESYLPAGYTWAFDPVRASMRESKTQYKKGTTATTIVDFFMLSPNLKLLTANTLDSNFEFSHHQAVGMIVELE